MADRIPDREQDALTFVIAGTILMRLTEVADDDRSIDGSNNHPDGDLGRVTGHHITAADAALGPHQSGPFERQQDLLEIGLRKAGAFGDVAHRCRSAVVVEHQGQQRAARIVSPRRDCHAGSVAPRRQQP